MTDPEVERSKLSSEESRRRIVERIVPALLAGREPQQEPTAVILLGRPGAGKTRVSEMIARRLNERGGFAKIDTDLYKPFHPDYRELMARDDRLMTLFIGPEGREWMRQAQDYVREHRINTLVHDIANDPAVSAAPCESRPAGTTANGKLIVHPDGHVEEDGPRPELATAAEPSAGNPRKAPP